MTQNHIGVHSGSLVYVLMASKEDFDSITRPLTDHSISEMRTPVLTKSVIQEGVTVIFQYWIENKKEF